MFAGNATGTLQWQDPSSPLVRIGRRKSSHVLMPDIYLAPEAALKSTRKHARRATLHQADTPAAPHPTRLTTFIGLPSGILPVSLVNTCKNNWESRRPLPATTPQPHTKTRRSIFAPLTRRAPWEQRYQTRVNCRARIIGNHTIQRSCSKYAP